ncbi:DUF1127 domain-containing protein [Nitratireductor mangrovi]|uniref:DUF1127 domain-containing protein n=1 Tax=Nitratireductor mangrovi TaxID=2599600 RepID=A0A5B8L3J1_9HYPH|nr:DUF1127 domain-containing protein [Nitratireductor mangrovi]QDZ02342.1 DUF1127 domain-containing protein [Nitratireductor mangrovi]
MTALHHDPIPLAGHVRPRIVARVLRVVAERIVQLWRAWKNQREVIRLAEMTDAQLADIGLVRGDLHAAAQTPLGVDPTAYLGLVSASRSREIEDAARRAN